MECELVLVCEKEKLFHKLYKLLYPSAQIESDVKNLSSTSFPEVDLLVVGPPCQPWSQDGDSLGDADSRGELLKIWVEHIPEAVRAIVLETVQGLMTKKHIHNFEKLKELLEEKGFECEHRILDTAENGVPHRRPRLYLVGIHTSCGGVSQLAWPEALRHVLPISQVLERTNHPVKNVSPATSSFIVRRVKAMEEAIRVVGIDPSKVTCFIDVDAGAGRASWTDEECPCLTRSRARTGGFYLTTHHRRMSTEEMCRLQGMSPSDAPWQNAGLSRTFFNGALGNAMSVNVLHRLLPRVLQAAGLIEAADWTDKWERPEYNPTKALGA